jgi:hypothetical protein
MVGHTAISNCFRVATVNLGSNCCNLTLSRTASTAFAVTDARGRGTAAGAIERRLPGLDWVGSCFVGCLGAGFGGDGCHGHDVVTLLLLVQFDRKHHGRMMGQTRS